MLTFSILLELEYLRTLNFVPTIYVQYIHYVNNHNICVYDYDYRSYDYHSTTVRHTTVLRSRGSTELTIATGILIVLSSQRASVR